jgi:hypothetical protein
MRVDDDHIVHYAPLLRRIIILVAIITAVPVMAWTATAFMRTYVAQPTIATAQPLAILPVPTVPQVAAAASAAGPTAPAAAAGAAQQPAPIVEARATATDARGADPVTRVDWQTGDATAGGVHVAGPMPASTATASAAPQPPIAAALTAQAAPAPPAPDVTSSLAPIPAAQPQAGDAATGTAADSSPPTDPLAGPVPLPRHRPSMLALADIGVPLPRARPAIEPDPAPSSSTTTDAPAGYNPGLGQTHY